MNEQFFHYDEAASPPARVINVEIGELVLEGFGPLDSRPVSSRRPNAARAAFRRELARELTDADPAAGQLAEAIADTVFRQLTARPPGGPR
jgi:hypothetical protein